MLALANCAGAWVEVPAVVDVWSLFSVDLFRSGLPSDVNTRSCVPLSRVHRDRPAKLGYANCAVRQHGDRAALSSMAA
jgi:hypothetical protein